MNGALRINAEGKVKKLVREMDHVSFSGARGTAQGQDVTYVTERCVMKLTPEGITVTEIAPGVDLQTQILNQSEFALKIAPRLKVMDAALFRPEPMGLKLHDRDHHTDPRIRPEIDGPLARRTIDRAGKQNALDYPMVLALEAAATSRRGRRYRPPASAWTGCATATARSMRSPACASRRSRCSIATPSAAGWNWPPAPISASPRTTTGQPETGLGIIPTGWAAEALAHALVDQVVPRGGGMAAAEAMAQRIAARGLEATQMVKLLINAAKGEDAERAPEALAGARAADTPALDEGAAAFKAKRPPIFP